DGKPPTAVTYVDRVANAFFQPADLVLLCAYGLWNTHLMLVSGLGRPYDPATGEGVVGRNYAYQTMASCNVFFEEGVRTNPFMGAGRLGPAIAGLNGDHLDHRGPGFGRAA